MSNRRVSNQERVWSSLTAQVLSGVAIVGIVTLGIWMSEHPGVLSRFGLSGASSPVRATGGNSQGTGSTPSSGSATSTSGANLNDPYAQKLQDKLDGVAGMQEVALGPSETGGSGEEVTATISVPVGTSLKSMEDSLINQYMAEVFATDPLVETANVYFISDGQFLAGGGLSRGAYEQWAVSTTAGQAGDVQAWMSGLPASGQGVSGWFETANPASAGN